MLASSCQTLVLKEIGSVSVISNRNFSLSQDYTILKSYAGSEQKDLKKNQAPNIQRAVDNLVKSVPGGEFVQNVKIYVVNSYSFAVTGDVYGIAANANMQGFKKGDHVSWKDGMVRYVGTISDLKNATEATVIQDVNQKVRTVKYADMEKVE